ncbi:MAG: hypothetical protein KDI09_17280 [Halioglobus sp.]|nr:hypothetical protein [Halioglobus sp.]
MGIFAFLCIFLGVYPEPLWALLPYPVDYEPYTAGKVLFYLQLLLFSGLAFFLLLPWMQRTMTISLDTDWFWRVFGRRLALAGINGLALLGARLGQGVALLRAQVAPPLLRLLDHTGALGRTWQVGTTALWIVVLLTTYVLLYFL